MYFSILKTEFLLASYIMHVNFTPYHIHWNLVIKTHFHFDCFLAVDRSISSSLSDARDALVNAVVDSLSAYGSTVSNLQHSALIAPSSLKLFPLYVLALLKQVALCTLSNFIKSSKTQGIDEEMKSKFPGIFNI